MQPRNKMPAGVAAAMKAPGARRSAMAHSMRPVMIISKQCGAGSRFRTYPDEAIAKKEEGTVAVGFKFARDGTVLDAWIEHGSGYPLLDDAALKMVRAASPIPKVPEQYKGEVLTLVMPERFRIGVFDRLFH
jgi:TonB family protein